MRSTSRGIVRPVRVRRVRGPCRLWWLSSVRAHQNVVLRRPEVRGNLPEERGRVAGEGARGFRRLHRGPARSVLAGRNYPAGVHRGRAAGDPFSPRDSPALLRWTFGLLTVILVGVLVYIVGRYMPVPAQIVAAYARRLSFRLLANRAREWLFCAGPAASAAPLRAAVWRTWQPRVIRSRLGSGWSKRPKQASLSPSISSARVRNDSAPVASRDFRPSRLRVTAGIAVAIEW
jgi:hypothetical protein